MAKRRRRRRRRVYPHFRAWGWGQRGRFAPRLLAGRPLAWAFTERGGSFAPPPNQRGGGFATIQPLMPLAAYATGSTTCFAAFCSKLQTCNARVSDQRTKPSTLQRARRWSPSAGARQQRPHLTSRPQGEASSVSLKKLPELCDSSPVAIQSSSFVFRVQNRREQKLGAEARRPSDRSGPRTRR